MVRLALAGRDTEPHLAGRLVSWLGSCWVAWGQRLQERFAENHPTQSLPVVDRTR